MNLLPFFKWCDATAISSYIRSSTTIFPVIEVVHLFGLTILLGTLTIIDLRILGIGCLFRRCEWTIPTRCE